MTEVEIIKALQAKEILSYESFLNDNLIEGNETKNAIPSVFLFRPFDGSLVFYALVSLS